MSYDSDIESVLGGSPDPHAALPRPPSREERRRARLKEDIPETVSAPVPEANLSAVNVKNGVTVNWLASVFGKSNEWVRQRLVDCPPLSQHGKSFRYDIKVAAEYLVDPKVDLERYLKQMRAADLPASLQKEIWDARLKRQKWEALAGDLWHTQDVMAVLSQTFSVIKSSIQLWPDTVERQEGLTDAQRELLVRLGDTLQDEIYQGLLTMAREKSTKASIADLDENQEDDDDLEDVL